MSFSFRRFGATNARGTCLWCGRKLRQQYNTKHEYTKQYRPPSECYYCPAGKAAKFKPVKGEPERFECVECGDNQQGDEKRKVVSRTKRYAKPGDYGDGHFCGLRCGYDFATALANNGRRLKPNQEHQED